MTTTSATPSVPSNNLPAENAAITLTFFNGFFDQTFSFDANEFSIVYGIFNGLRIDEISIYTLAFSVLAEAKLTNTDPGELARRLIAKDGLQLDPVTVQLFNRSRKRTSFVGYRTNWKLNPFVEHLLVE
jgi:hypothetical protein